MSLTLENLKNSFSSYQSCLKKFKLAPVDFSEEAFAKFSELGFPTLKNEDWKYTNVNTVIKNSIQNIVIPKEVQPKQSHRFLVEDGLVQEVMSVPGLSWHSLTSNTLNWNSIESEFQPLNRISDGFQALSLAMPSDVLYIEIDAHTKLERPIEIEFVSQDQKHSLLQPQIYILLKEGSEASLVEKVFASQKQLMNTQVRVKVKQRAQWNQVKLIEADSAEQYLSQQIIQQEKQSFAQVSYFTRGGEVLRNSVIIEQLESEAESICNGLYFTKEKEHADFRVNMRHLHPMGVSRQLFKGVLKDRSRAVFNGKIYIEKQAQKVDSAQLNSNLVLSKHAEVDSKPELEVYADDVKANHGSAIGRLDEDQLFYLMSRAIPKEEAVKILARGFVEEVVLKIAAKDLRQPSQDWLEQTLQQFQENLEQARGFDR